MIKKGIIMKSKNDIKITNKHKNRIIKKDTFRSTPFVNITDDMLRVVVDIERKWFFKLQKLIDNLNT